jgi:hypothetical protein
MLRLTVAPRGAGYKIVLHRCATVLQCDVASLTDTMHVAAVTDWQSLEAADTAEQ